MDPYLYNAELEKSAKENPVHLQDLPFELLEDIFSHLGFHQKMFNRRYFALSKLELWLKSVQ